MYLLLHHILISCNTSELSTTYLRTNKHILDFLSCVKGLRSSILDSERRARTDTASKIAEVDALTARSFCDRLPNCFTKPFDALATAKLIAKR